MILYNAGKAATALANVGSGSFIAVGVESQVKILDHNLTEIHSVNSEAKKVITLYRTIAST